MTNLRQPRLRERFINFAGTCYLNRKRGRPTRKVGVAILNYHRMSGGSFRKQLGYIRKHYQILSPESFLGWLDDEVILERPSVVFTFDDGYRSFYEEIYPVLQETETPVFMFISTGFIGKRGHFWADELQVASEKSNVRVITVDGRKFYLYSRLYRSDFYANIQEYVRAFDEAGRNEICKCIFRQLNVRLSEKDMEGYRFLNWPEILEMDRSGLVLFGSHSVNHPNLSILPHDVLKHELLESKHALENHLTKSVETFAYPYGERGFFDESTVAEVEKAGYSCAFTTIQDGLEGRNRFRLPRVLLFDYQNEGAVALKLDKYARGQRKR
jgi:peptidoglycan/xylan/chitin deacetylase (PgdA/CDA1 family)